MQLEAGKPCPRRSTQSAGRSLRSAGWLVPQVGEVEAWTSAAVLRRNGLCPHCVAAWLHREYELADPAKARPAEAFAALTALALPDGGTVHNVMGEA